MASYTTGWIIRSWNKYCYSNVWTPYISYSVSNIRITVIGYTETKDIQVLNGVTPDILIQNGLAKYGTLLEFDGYGGYGYGVEWTDPRVTPDSMTKDGTAYYWTIIQTVGYGSYGLGASWTKPGDYS